MSSKSEDKKKLRDEIEIELYRQDEVLTDISAGLERLRESADAIKKESTSQGKMLEELNGDVEEAKSGVDRVMRGVGQILKTNNNIKIKSILFLIIVLFILIILVIVL